MKTMTLSHGRDRNLSMRWFYHHDPRRGKREGDGGEHLLLKIRQGPRYARTIFSPASRCALELTNGRDVRIPLLGGLRQRLRLLLQDDLGDPFELAEQRVRADRGSSPDVHGDALDVRQAVVARLILRRDPLKRDVDDVTSPYRRRELRGAATEAA